jgi:hypothetical protein
VVSRLVEIEELTAQRQFRTGSSTKSIEDDPKLCSLLTAAGDLSSSEQSLPNPTAR